MHAELLCELHDAFGSFVDIYCPGSRAKVTHTLSHSNQIGAIWITLGHPAGVDGDSLWPTDLDHILAEITWIIGVVEIPLDGASWN